MTTIQKAKRKKTDHPIPVTERDFSRQIEDLFNLFGWRWTHFRPAMNQAGGWRTPLSGYAGFVDYVAVHPEKKRVLFAELKSEKGKVTEQQQEWLDTLTACGQEVYLVRPADIDDFLQVLREPLTEPVDKGW